MSIIGSGHEYLSAIRDPDQLLSSRTPPWRRSCANFGHRRSLQAWGRLATLRAIEYRRLAGKETYLPISLDPEMLHVMNDLQVA
jgi:hypothetical protein